MNLPRLDLPEYELELPSNGKKIKYRPYVTKEKKLLLMAMESGDDDAILESIKQIVRNCVLTPDFNVDKLASFDLEWFFLNLRARSVGEVVKTKYICRAIPNVGEDICGAEINLEYKLLETKVIKADNHTNKLLFGNKIGIIMRYPNVDMMQERDERLSDIEKTFGLIVDCVEAIFDSENIYRAEDMSYEEIAEFVESLPDAEFAKIEEFFNSIPFLQTIIEKDCPKCKYHHKITLEGLSSFFD